MTKPASIADECPECKRLLNEYEAATENQAKVHNELDIAEHLHDLAIMRRLTLEAYEVTARRRRPARRSCGIRSWLTGAE